MNMFARFNENPAMILQDIKETKRYGRTDNVKTVYPLQTKFAGDIMTFISMIIQQMRDLKQKTSSVVGILVFMDS